MANKNLVVGATLLFCAAAFAQSTPSSKSEDATAAAPAQTVTTARETASGKATGKTASPAAAASADVKAPRDHASGQASGKREAQHEPAKIEVPDLKAQAPTGTHHLEKQNIVHRDLAAREASSGQATAVTENAAAADHEVKAPRDVATGQASGKRMHKPMTVKAESDSSESTARETASGMATGKRENKIDAIAVHHEIVSPRDSASGLPTGKRQHKPMEIRKEVDAKEVGASADSSAARETGSGMATGKRQHGAPLGAKGKMDGAQSNPMYKDDGKSGVNPLYENKDDKRVQSGVNTAAGAVANGTAVVKTKTKSNQSNDRVAVGDVDGDGKADVAASAPAAVVKSKTKSNQSNDRRRDRIGYEGAGGPDASGAKITKSRSNIQNNRVTNSAGTADPTPAEADASTKISKGDAGVTGSQKASINTTRSNIKHSAFSDVGNPDPNAAASPKAKAVSMGAFDSPAAVKATKTRSNIQNNRVAAGDVNGDGAADAQPVPTAEAAAAKANAAAGADNAAPAKKADPYGNITWGSTGTGSSDAKPAAMGNSKATPSKK